MRSFGWLALLWLSFSACTKPNAPTTDQLLPEPPPGFPAVEYPEGNAHTDVRWELGRALFFDTRLSIGNDVSCGTCHLPEAFLTDPRPTTPGTLGRAGNRNVPSLLNVAYHPYIMREGGVATLEQQILVPIQEHNEFGHNIVDIAAELAEDPTLRSMSIAAYGEPPSPFTITRSIAVFERSLLSGGSAYDRYINGQSNALTPSEERGMELFFSEDVGCAGCHGGFNFTEYEIVNNGLYQHFSDPGLYRLTKDPLDSGKFKVPSLRNVAMTPPYMHDGSLADLDAVMDHYASGGADHTNQDPRVHPLSLSVDERFDLMSFLEALTDETYYAERIAP